MTERDLAIQFPEAGQVRLVELDRDDRPLGPQEVQGRTGLSLISPGTELAGFVGHWGAKWPITPGYANIFELTGMGVEVQDLRPGQLVFCMGNHRLWQRHERKNVIPLPEGLAPEKALFCRIMGVSMSTLATTTARPPERVLVIGLGIVGNLGAQVFQSCGYRVTACDPVPSRRELAAKCGLADVREQVPLEDPRLSGQVALAVDCSGHEQAVLDACRIVRQRAEVVLVGVPWVRRSDLPAFDLLHAVFHRYVVLRSGWEWELPDHPTNFRAGSIFANLAAGMDWLAQGRIRVDGLARIQSPRQAQQAYTTLLSGEAPHLTVMFDWRNARTS